MSNIISIKLDNKEMFYGDVFDIPIKEKIIIEKCIELFSDDNPCIIHKSFAIKKILFNTIKNINNLNKTIVDARLLGDDFINFVDIKDIDKCSVYLYT